MLTSLAAEWKLVSVPRRLSTSEGSQANDVTQTCHLTAAAPRSVASMTDIVRSLVCETLELPVSAACFGDEDALVSAGLSSMGLVALILALESRLDVEVPRREMAAVQFRSVASIAALMARLAAPPGSLPKLQPDRHAAE